MVQKKINEKRNIIPEGKFLILDSSGTDWTDRQMQRENVTVDAIYKRRSFILRIIRRIYFLLNLPFKFIWYGNWKRCLDRYDYIIIFSALMEKDIFKYIRRYYNKKLIFYYRDPMIATPYNPLQLQKLNADIDIWSFDKADSAQYNLGYNPQFYFCDIVKKEIDLKYDVVFVGFAKRRLDEIIYFKQILEQLNMKSYFHIMPSRGIIYNKHEKENLSDRMLEYERILELNVSSKAILEINQQGQIGMTVRAMEALFIKRKLITNNQYIQEAEFYHPDNIFIIGVDNIINLKDFLARPYHKIDETIIEEYSYEKWLGRFKKVSDKIEFN